MLLGGSDLDELTANFDDDLDFALRLGQSSDWLEDISRICYHAYRLLRQVKLTKMKVRLEVLQAADKMVLYIPRVEDAVVISGRHSQHSAEAFPGSESQYQPSTG